MKFSLPIHIAPDILTDGIMTLKLPIVVSCSNGIYPLKMLKSPIDTWQLNEHRLQMIFPQPNVMFFLSRNIVLGASD